VPQPGDVVIQTPSGPVVHQESESWFDPAGLIALPTPERLASPPPKSDPAADLAAARQQFATDGPSLQQPTLAWLAQLPADPASLRGLVDPPGQMGSAWSDDRDVFDAVQELLRLAEPLLSGATRAGLYELLGQLPNLSAARLVADGQPLVAIRSTETATKPGGSTTATEEILIDPATGHAVGLGDQAGQSRSQSLVFWSVVNTLGDRP
jgi:hypothetical protein